MAALSEYQAFRSFAPSALREGNHQVIRSGSQLAVDYVNVTFPFDRLPLELKTKVIVLALPESPIITSTAYANSGAYMASRFHVKDRQHIVNLLRVNHLFNAEIRKLLFSRVSFVFFRKAVHFKYASRAMLDNFQLHRSIAFDPTRTPVIGSSALSELQNIHLAIICRSILRGTTIVTVDPGDSTLEQPAIMWHGKSDDFRPSALFSLSFPATFKKLKKLTVEFVALDCEEYIQTWGEEEIVNHFKKELEYMLRRGKIRRRGGTGTLKTIIIRGVQGQMMKWFKDIADKQMVHIVFLPNSFALGEMNELKRIDWIN